MSTMKYASLDLGTIEGVFNKLGGLEGAQRFLRGELVVTEPKRSDFLRLLSGGQTLTIGATDGKQTIAQAGDVFTAYIDSDFKNWNLDVPGKAKPATKVEVHELVKDGRIDQFFPSLGQLDDLCLEQDQIIKFCLEYKQWLRTEGWATLFLFKVANQFFVARVYFVDGGHLRVRVRRFSDGRVWRAGDRGRVVVPQLCPSGS